MPTIEPSITNFFLDRLTAFWSYNKIARSLDQNPASVARWHSQQTRPSIPVYEDFIDALKDLSDELRIKSHSKGDFFDDLADMVLEGIPPLKVSTFNKSYKNQFDHDRLDNMLLDMLPGPAKQITNELTRMGFTLNHIRKRRLVLNVHSRRQRRGTDKRQFEWYIPR